MPSALAVLNKVIVGALYPQNGVMCCVAQFAGQGHYKLFCFCCMRWLVWIAVFCAFSSKAPLILYSSLHFSIQHYRLSCCIPADVLIIHSDEYSSNKIESKCMALIKCFSLTTIAFCPHNRSQQLRNCEMWIHKAQNQAHAPLLTNCVNLGMLFYLKHRFLIYKMGVMTSTL